MDKSEIIPMIKRELKNRHMPKAALARGLNKSHATIQGLLNRETLSVKWVVDLCDFFQYNFFREIAEKFPYEEPVYREEKQPEALTSQLAEQQERLKELEIEVKILRQVVKDFAGSKS